MEAGTESFARNFAGHTPAAGAVVAAGSCNWVVDIVVDSFADTAKLAEEGRDGCSLDRMAEEKVAAADAAARRPAGLAVETVSCIAVAAVDNLVAVTVDRMGRVADLPFVGLL